MTLYINIYGDEAKPGTGGGRSNQPGGEAPADWSKPWVAPDFDTAFEGMEPTNPVQANEDEGLQYFKEQSPEGQQLQGIQQEIVDEKEQKVRDDSASLYKSVGQQGAAPSEKDYDYQDLVRTRDSITPNEEDGGLDLPNAHIQKNKVEIFGYDLSTGQQVRDRLPDPDGLVAEGIAELHQSQTNTVNGAPIEDTSALTKIGVGHIRNGGSYADFKAQMPKIFTDEQLKMSYRVANDYVQKEDLIEFINSDDIPAPDDAPLPSWDLTDEELKANDLWMNSARVMYRNLEGEEFAGSDEELYDLSLELMSQFNWNASKMAYYIYKVMNGPDDMKRAMYAMMKMYDSKDTTMDDVGNNLMSVGTDAFTYAGLGVGKFAMKGGQMLVKKGMTETLEKFVMAGTIGAVEGGAFTGFDDWSRQMVEIEAGAKKEYDKAQGAMATGAGVVGGMVLGPAIVFGGEKVVKYGKDLHGRVSAMRANPDAPSRTSLTRQKGSAGFPIDPESPQAGVSSLGIIDQTPRPFAPDPASLITPSNQVAKHIHDRSINSLAGRDLSAHTPENIDFISDVMAEEVMKEIAKDRAKGRTASAKWYKETLEDARNIVSVMYPEVQKDMTHRHAFDFALAITSNGQNVRANSKSAIKAYDFWRENGKFPEATGYINAEKGPIMTRTFKDYNALVDEIGVEKVIELLRTEFSVRDLTDMGYTVTGENMDTRLPFSVIFGPKVGGGFYSNLQGDWHRLTPDIWFTRTWGRITGNLIRSNPELAQKHYAEFRAGYVANKKTVQKYLGFAPKISEITDEWIDEYGPILFRKWSTTKGPKGESFPDKANPMHTVPRAIANRLKPQETPTGGAERTMMREATEAAVQKLDDSGHDLTVSSVQSTLWYPEQRLWDQLGSKQNNKELDYAKAFSEILNVDRARGRVSDPLNRGPQKPSVSGGLSAELARTEAKTGALRNLRKGPRGLAARRPAGSVYVGAKAPAGDAGGTFIDGARVKTVHSVNTKKTTRAGTPANIYKKQNITTEPWNELAPGPAGDEAFNRAITKSKKAIGKDAAAVYVYPAKGEGSLESATKYLSADGQSGFAIKDDGDIVSIFNASGRPNAGLSALMLALEHGGTKLDCFETILPKLYRQAGFQVTKRQKWSEKYKPKGWDKKHYKAYNNGEPDVVQMTYQPDHIGPPAKGTYGEFE